MGSLDAWRDTIERILSEYAAIPYRYGDVRTEVVFDRKRDRYLIVDTGWERGDRVYGTIVHVDICDGRVWIQYDGTERGVAPELVTAGIPRESIVLGFREPELRKYTGFAAA
jgi:XisI protein